MVDDDEWIASHGGSARLEAGQLAQRILAAVFNGGTASPIINATSTVNGFLQQAYQRFTSDWKSSNETARKTFEQSLETAATAAALLHDKDLQQRGVNVDNFRKRASEDADAFRAAMEKFIAQASPKKTVQKSTASSFAETYWHSAAGLGAYAERLDEYRYPDWELSLGELERFNRERTISMRTLEALAFFVQPNISVIQSEEDIFRLFDQAGTLAHRISYYVIDWNVRSLSEDLISPPASTHGLKPVFDRLHTATYLWSRVPSDERSRISRRFIGQLLKFKNLPLQPFAAGLEEGETTIDGLVIPSVGTPLNWYSTLGTTNGLVPTGLLDILDPKTNRLAVPLAEVPGNSVLSVQEGALEESVLAGLEEAGVKVRRFALDNVPSPMPGRENVYVVMVVAGSERSLVRDPSAIVINLSSDQPRSAPKTLRELGALINAARGADRRVLWVGVIYRSDFQNAIIAIDTQL